MVVARTRFAPSPTGFMHVGSLRTALFGWLVARQAGGQFILRLEDTDKAREVEGSEKHIIDSLDWLGLMPDEGPGIGGDYGPYRQSERLEIYKDWGKRLVDSGRAYADPYTTAEVQAFRDQAQKAKIPFLYRNHRPDNPPLWDGRQPLRFKSEPKAYQWHDEVMGDLSTGPEIIDDFIIIKSDGYPTYNFAHIIDDHLMKCSHVIRSQEFLPSIPKFLNLYEALNLARPKLATLPYVMGADGKKKLGKRDGAKDILDYQREGYLPEALINFLVTLGWNDGTEQEIFSVDELIQKFSLGKVQKSGAHFDERRLMWMNGQYIRRLSSEELSKRAEKFWPKAVAGHPESYKQAVLGLVRERLKFLAELPGLTEFFFEEPSTKKVGALYKDPVDKPLQGLVSNDYLILLAATTEELAASDFSEADIQRRLNALMKRLGSTPGILFSTLRIAVTGHQMSPEIFGTLATLGKERSLQRLKKALEALQA